MSVPESWTAQPGSLSYKVDEPQRSSSASAECPCGLLQQSGLADGSESIQTGGGLYGANTAFCEA